jgi:hypothetical protein
MTPRKPLPSRERLRELFDYHEDGYFVRLADVSTWFHAGDEVRGTAHSNGYLQASVDGTVYQFNRLVFQWHHGWCPDIVDHHPDRDRHNCRIGNLRPATFSESTLNQGVRTDSTTGVTGVSLVRGRYYARVKRSGVRHFLGYHDTVEGAAAAIVALDAARLKA